MNDTSKKKKNYDILTQRITRYDLPWKSIEISGNKHKKHENWITTENEMKFSFSDRNVL